MSEKDNKFGWGNYTHPMSREIIGSPSNAVSGVTPAQAAQRRPIENMRGAMPIDLPGHLFTPPGAESVDIRVAADIAALTTVPTLLMSFRAPKGSVTHFISYGIFSDGSLAANQEFIPRVNGRRAFPYQGDPQNNFKINLGLAPDLSNSSLIQCQLTLNPDEVVEWYVTNLNAVDIAMGVRMVGYVDYSQKRINARSGG